MGRESVLAQVWESQGRVGWEKPQLSSLSHCLVVVDSWPQAGGEAEETVSAGAAL